MANDGGQKKKWLGIGLVVAALALGGATLLAWPLLEGRGGPMPGEPPAQRGGVDDGEARRVVDRGSVSVGQVVGDPDAWSRCPFVVSGRVFPQADGFFLVDGEASIWVAAADVGSRGLRSGERATFRVDVQRLTEKQALELRSRPRPGGDLPPVTVEAIQGTPTAPGDPSLVLRTVDDSEAGADERESAADTIYELGDVQNRLEVSCLNVTRTGLGSVLDEEIGTPTLAAVRYEIVPGGREFELLIFPSPRAARSALDAVRDTEMVENGGAVAVGANVVAAFPEPPESFRGYEVVRDVVRGLG